MVWWKVARTCVHLTWKDQVGFSSQTHDLWRKPNCHTLDNGPLVVTVSCSNCLATQPHYHITIAIGY